MTNPANELHTGILIRAIVKDATGYMETIDKEDLPCNEQHKKCLGIIARAFDAKEECDEALELLRRWEDAIQNDTRPDLSGLNAIDTDTLNPISVTLEFFNAALRLEDSDEQKELYNMADYIGAAAEILCETKA
ncbi:MAG: hypothetical protein PHU76_01580 [Synergistaceae bacterium]|nr:hypothetical protein [Proteiniphilum sp.]MDD3963130.1 hypothetical protein [Synergistaceae bacterium]